MLSQVSGCRGALLVLLVLLCACAAVAPAAPVPPAPLLIVRVGERPAALAGPWQFHLGDDRNWADPQLSSDGWEWLSANRTWARQGHFKYTGYAWYRLHVQFQQEDLQSPEVSLLIPRVDDVYEIYWNGVLVGRNGKFPPNPRWPEFGQPPQIIGLGHVHEGVLAVRVWKAPALSEDTGLRGGFEHAPLAGTPYGVAMVKTLLDYDWLRSRQLYFGLNSLYGLIGLITLITWIRNRGQWQLFWMAGFALSHILDMIFYQLRLPWSVGVAGVLWQPCSAFRGVCLSFLLLWLLQLRESRALVRLTQVCAWLSIVLDSLDGLTYFLIWKPGWTRWVQIGDGLLMLVYVLMAALPLVLVTAALSRREHLNKTRWLVAVCALLAGMVQVAGFATTQGSRFTHWTVAERIAAPIFVWNGNSISLVTITSTLLLLASAFAVYRSFEENRRRQQGLLREFESARALQQVLVPENAPEVAGYRVSSVYRPALEVGGDFFQVVPLETWEGSTLVLVGDVSGKGLRAAMAVSFIVGAVRVLAKQTARPGELLSLLNGYLLGRLQNGFATCVAVRLDPDGRCVIASAGHPSPFIDNRELHLEGAFPLGLFPGATYDELEFTLQPGEICTLFTDGLTESRAKDGALFGEERIAKLLCSRPTVQKIAETAIEFGQDDDITVVSFTRLETESHTLRSFEDATVEAALGPAGTPAAVIG